MTIIKDGHKTEPLFQSVNKWWLVDCFDGRFLRAWLNNSRLGSFLTCPKQFWYAEFSGIEGTTSKLIEDGRLAHSIIEYLNNHLPPRKLWDAANCYPILYNIVKKRLPFKGEVKESIKKYLRRMNSRIKKLKIKYKIYGEFRFHLIPLSNEQYIILDDGDNMFGTLDCVVNYDDGSVIIVDYKHSNAKINPKGNIHLPDYYKRQAYFYCYLFTTNYIQPPAGYTFHFLKSDTLISNNIYSSDYQDLLKKIEGVRKQIFGCLWRGIWRKKPNILCHWCNWKIDCDKNLLDNLNKKDWRSSLDG